MNFRQYNDYEILDLVKQGNDEALELMIRKYRYFIAKKIVKYNLTAEYDDSFQEGLLVLYRSILRFEEKFGKSFTKYFETNLEHCYISILRKAHQKQKFYAEKVMLIAEDAFSPGDDYSITSADVQALVALLSPMEKQIFEARFLRQREVGEIATSLDVPPKAVYNAIDRIRQKIKLHLGS